MQYHPSTVCPSSTLETHPTTWFHSEMQLFRCFGHCAKMTRKKQRPCLANIWHKSKPSYPKPPRPNQLNIPPSKSAFTMRTSQWQSNSSWAYPACPPLMIKMIIFRKRHKMSSKTKTTMRLTRRNPLSNRPCNPRSSRPTSSSSWTSERRGAWRGLRRRTNSMIWWFN